MEVEWLLRGWKLKLRVEVKEGEVEWVDVDSVDVERTEVEWVEVESGISVGKS